MGSVLKIERFPFLRGVTRLMYCRELLGILIIHSVCWFTEAVRFVNMAFCGRYFRSVACRPTVGIVFLDIVYLTESRASASCASRKSIENTLTVSEHYINVGYSKTY